MSFTICSDEVALSERSDKSVIFISESLQTITRFRKIVGSTLSHIERTNKQWRLSRLYIRGQDVTGGISTNGLANAISRIIRLAGTSLRTFDMRGCTFDYSESLFVTLECHHQIFWSEHSLAGRIIMQSGQYYWRQTFSECIKGHLTVFASL